MSAHSLLTVDASPRGLHRANAVDVFCHWKGHVAAAEAVAR